MPNESVFLTGATGTVGSGILEVLVSAGFEVHCLVRRADAAQSITQAGGRAVLGDMTDSELFRRLSGRLGFTYIIHAAQAHYRHHPKEEIHRQERIAVGNLETLRGPETRLMVFTCGVWIYGNCAKGSFIDESTTHTPREAAAGRSLLMTELAARRDSRWAKFCLPSFVYGSTGPLIDIANRFRDGDVEVLDDESVLWSVIERLDLGRAYLALLRCGKPGDYYLVAENAPVSVVVLHETIAGHLQCGHVIRKPSTQLARTSTSHPVNSERFKQNTGWRARESFMTSFARFLPARRR